MSKPRLSGFHYQVWDWSRIVKKGSWQTEVMNPLFDYCFAKEKCLNAKEHEYAFDGQFFYKKRLAYGSRPR